MKPLRYGIAGGGFISAFQLRALQQVRGVEVAGLVSRRPPEQLAAFVKKHGLGEGRIFANITELARHVDVIALFAPNFARVEMVEEVVAAARAGAELKGVICEKPLARNLAEARRVVQLVEEAGLRHAYFENQLHMKSMQTSRASWRRSSRRWAHRCWSARPKSTPARTTHGSGTRCGKGAA